MHANTRAFCRLAAEIFDPRGPIYEFGSYQVEGQERISDLRPFFLGKKYIGCDLRLGPGVDRLEDVTDLRLADHCAGTVISVATLEHVFHVHRAFEEMYRVLRPGGLLIVTTVLNFRIHDYPADYWRLTPQCLRRLVEPYGARLVGSQGFQRFPHTVLGVAAKDPAPADFGPRAEQLGRAFQDWLGHQERSLGLRKRLGRSLAMIYRSKGERRRLAHAFGASFTLEVHGVPARAAEPAAIRAASFARSGLAEDDAWPVTRDI